MAEAEMKIGAIAPWFGGKRTMAPAIVRELGAHKSFWEPFCGSMAVLMAKPACRQETVNDLHGDLINLARVIQDPAKGMEMYRRLRRMLVAEAELEASTRLLDAAPPLTEDDPPSVDRAQAYFALSWLMRSGVAGTNMNKRGAGRNIAVRYTVNGGDLVPRWNNAIASIPAWRRRLRNVLILQRDAFNVLAKIDDAPGTVIYCDPPYLPETRTGMNGSGAQSRYLHEFNDGFMSAANDHERLAQALGRFRRARVVVSYYRNAALAKLYPGWTVRDMATTKSIVSQGRRDGENKVEAPEVLLINGPSYAESEAA